MKTFLYSLAVGTLLLVSQTLAQGSTCTISDSSRVGSSNTLIFTLSPSIEDLLAMRPGLNSPFAIASTLNSFLNPAQIVANSIISAFNTLLPRPLSSLGIAPTIPTCQFMWISNQLICDNVPTNILDSLCRIVTGIRRISTPINYPLLPRPQTGPLACESDKLWGLHKINSTDANALGFSGQGVVVANIDTGVRSTHQELVGNFRSTYNWYNAYNPSNTIPEDDKGHGTHSMATMVGKTVGVAPGATWIACKGCSATKCSNPELLACMQWAMCPDREAKNCTTAPKIINNSWGGGTGDNSFNSPLAAFKAAGIFNFFSSGNGGPTCGSIVSPADADPIKGGFFSVGSTACNDVISSFSSTGPSKAPANAGGLGVLIVGPGTNIYSAWNGSDTDYRLDTGTSMSSPHASGVAAILLSKNPDMTYTQLSMALENSAYRNPNIRTAATECGSGTTNSVDGWPNSVYGYGRVNALDSLNLV